MQVNLIRLAINYRHMNAVERAADCAQRIMPDRHFPGRHFMIRLATPATQFIEGFASPHPIDPTLPPPRLKNCGSTRHHTGCLTKKSPVARHRYESGMHAV
jgi:hypothetical protein